MTSGRRLSDVRKLRKTLALHYAQRRKKWAEDFPDFHDADLRRIFAGDGGRAGAGAFMRRHSASLIASLVQWTGQRKYAVTGLVRRVTARAQLLELSVPESDEARARVRVELAAYLATMVTNHLHTGRFKRSL